MPSNVAWFERLMYTSLLLLVGSHYFLVQQELARFPDDLRFKLALIGLPIPLVIILALLIWLAARRRKSWARWVLAVLIVWNFGSTLYTAVWLVVNSSTFAQVLGEKSLIEGALHAVRAVIELVALILVYTGNAREWFARPQLAR